MTCNAPTGWYPLGCTSRTHAHPYPAEGLHSHTQRVAAAPRTTQEERHAPTWFSANCVPSVGLITPPFCSLWPRATFLDAASSMVRPL